MSHFDRGTVFTTQPGKTIWTALILAYGLARLPFWLVYFIPSRLRPDQRWSWAKAVRMRVVTVYLQWVCDVEQSPRWNLLPGAEMERWVNLDPAASKYFTGVCLVDPQVKPAKTGGTWYPSQPAPEEKSGKVCLHFHGGAFVIGDSRMEYAGPLAKTLLKHAGVSRVFCSEYRLSSHHGNHFPAALQDAITAYAYLINEKKISPADIVVSGDSAGANLTLALLRYIAEHGQQVGLRNPGCAFLWSPWTNPGDSLESYHTWYQNPHLNTDYLPQSFLVWGVECYEPAKSTELTYDHEYINFTAHQFKTETPLFFSLCEKEILWFDGYKAYDGFTKIAGNKTELSIELAAPHDIVLVGHLVGFEAEAAEAAKKAGKFLSSL